MKLSARASLLAVALILVGVTASYAGGRVVIGGPVFYWGPPYPYYPYPYYYGNPYYSWADEQERRQMAQVRLTTEAAMLSACTYLGVVTDDSVKDMRRKIVRAGGNAAAMDFPVDNLKMMRAEVYRCPTAKASTASPERSSPPPPPAGTPPPPPPAR